MRSTEHVRLMLNQAWWMRLAIINMSHRKRIWTLESFFAPKESQGESEKNDTEEDHVLIRKKRMRVEVNWKNQEITRGSAMKRRRCSAIFVGNLRGQTPLHQQKGVQISVHLKIKMSPKILAKGTNCPPVIKSYSSNPGHMYTPSHRDLL